MADGTRGLSQMQTFRPGPANARAYRDALGSFGTGVTIVTCMTGNGPLAMTANSFTSVSLDPALVLWSPAVASSRHDAFVAAHAFAIHILSVEQLALARAFASDGRCFDGCLWTAAENGAPAIDGALARLDCVHHAAHGAGDHTIVLGRVEQVASRSGTPLLFAGGRYGSFAEGDFTNGT